MFSQNLGFIWKSLQLTLGKSLICKEKCIQTDEKESNLVDKELKAKADPVFFISMVGVDDEGKVDEYEYLFDIFTKLYDFDRSNVQVISAQDLWNFYLENKLWYQTSNQMKVSIYKLVGQPFFEFSQLKPHSFILSTVFSCFIC